jgi:hypothetical protein
MTSIQRYGHTPNRRGSAIPNGSHRVSKAGSNPYQDLGLKTPSTHQDHRPVAFIYYCLEVLMIKLDKTQPVTLLTYLPR